MRAYRIHGVEVQTEGGIPGHEFSAREVRMIALWGLFWRSHQGLGVPVLSFHPPGGRPDDSGFWFVGNQSVGIYAYQNTREMAVERLLVTLRRRVDRHLDALVDYLWSDGPLPEEIDTMTVTSIATTLAHHVARQGLEQTQDRARRHQADDDAKPKEHPVPQITTLNPTPGDAVEGRKPLVRHASTVRARMKDLFEGVGATILTMVDTALALNPPKEEYRFDLLPYSIPKDTREAILAELRAQGYSAAIHGTPMEVPGGPIPTPQDILVVTVPREVETVPPRRR